MINTYNESSLHKTLKNLYSLEEGCQTEVKLDGFIYDIVTKDNHIIEIQTQNISKLKTKAEQALLKGRKFQIIYPLAKTKRIITKDKDGKILSNRKSPKSESIYSMLKELTGLYTILLNKSFTLTVLECAITEIRIRTDEPVQLPTKRRHFLKNWIKTDKILNEIIKTHNFKNKEDYLSLIPKDTPVFFSSKSLKECLSDKNNISNKDANQSSLLIWLFNKMEIIEQIGKEGKTRIFKIS